MVNCMYPDPDALGRERSEEPPEGWPEWRDPSGECQHADCLFADDVRKMVANYLPSIPAAEIRADQELFWDEFHGRDPDG